MKKLLFSFVLLTATFAQAQLQVDANYPSNGKFNNAISKIIKQNDNKMLVIGDFGLYNSSINIHKIARLNADGTLDTTFNSGNSVGTANIYDAKQMPDGKILLAGNFSSYNGTATKNLIRINSDGTLDNTFTNEGFYFNGSYTGALYSIGLQADGKILVGGYFDKYGTTNRSGIARLNSDGTLDTTYDPGLAVNNGVGGNHYIRKVVELTDNTILLGGRYDSFNGSNRTGIARTTSTGSVHGTFTNGTNTDVTSIVVQPDGKVIIAGSFTSVGGYSHNRIARLNSNGTIDATFNAGTGANGWVYDVKLLPNNKILLAGGFSAYNGTTIRQLALLNSNGTLDTNFNNNTSADISTVYTVETTHDNKILIGGSFNGYLNNSNNKYFLCVYDTNVTLSSNEINNPTNKVTIYPNPTSDKLNINTKDTLKSVAIYSANGKLVKQTKDKEINVNNLATGKYTLHIKTNKGTHTDHFIKK